MLSGRHGLVTKAAKCVLTVAHLDHQPENCAEDNLRAMCQGCHNRYDVPHRRQTREIHSPQLRMPLTEAP
jgi:hypothetical protein